MASTVINNKHESDRSIYWILKLQKSNLNTLFPQLVLTKTYNVNISTNKT